MSRSDAEPVRTRLAASVDAGSAGGASAATPRAVRQSVVSPPASPSPVPPLSSGVPEAPGTQAPAASPDGHYGRLRDGVRRLRASARTFKVTDRTLLVAGGILAPIGILVIIVGWWGAAHSPFLFQQVPYLISGGLLGLALVILGSFLYFGYWLTQVVKEQRRQATAVVEAIERLERVAAGLARSPTPARNGHSPSPPAASDLPGVVGTAQEVRPTDAERQATTKGDGRVTADTGASTSSGVGSRTPADRTKIAYFETGASEGPAPSADAATQGAVTQAVALPGADPGSSQPPEVFGDPVLDTLVTTPEAVFVATAKGTMAHHRDCVVVAGKTGLRQVTRADGLIPCKLCAPYDA